MAFLKYDNDDKNWIRLKAPGNTVVAVRTSQPLRTIPISSTQRNGAATADSGMLTNYRPAQHQKTSGPVARVINQITRVFTRAFRKEDPAITTEQGSSATAAPSIYQFVLWQERYERRAVVQECRQAFDDDPRIQRSCRMFGREAVRGGVVITLSGTENLSDETLSKCQKVAENVQNLVNPLLESWATYLPVEGEQFTQAIVKGSIPNGEIVKVKRMPTSSMERNTDDADEFIDPARAFSQVDILTNGEIATFPLSLMHHTRWNWVDGDRYGKSEIISIRRLRRLVMLCEDAQTRRRISRAPQRIHWKFGGAMGGEIITANWNEIETFKEKNGFVNGVREMFDPVETGRDTFGSLVEPIVVKGDQTVHEIEDLKYLQNVMGVGLPTPGPIYNLDASNVNRDLVEDLRAEWLKQSQLLSGKLAEIVSWLMDLGLLLQGILPEAVDYVVRFSESTVETPSEMVKRVVEARAATIGSGRNAVPSPLISLNTAVRTLAEHFDVKNVPDEMRDIYAELAVALGQIQTLSMTGYGTKSGAGQTTKSGGTTSGKKTGQKVQKTQTPPSIPKMPMYSVPNNTITGSMVLAGGGNPRPKKSSRRARRDEETNLLYNDPSDYDSLVEEGDGDEDKPTAYEANRPYSGVGQLAALYGTLYGIPEETDPDFTGNLNNRHGIGGSNSPAYVGRNGNGHKNGK